MHSEPKRPKFSEASSSASLVQPSRPAQKCFHIGQEVKFTRTVGDIVDANVTKVHEDSTIGNSYIIGGTCYAEMHLRASRLQSIQK